MAIFQDRDVLGIFLLILLLGGCSSAYYNTLEKIGIHKRDLMVDRVADARDAQEKAKVQFKSALEQFRSVIRVDGGDLQKEYDVLKDGYAASKARSEAVHKRIAKVESVAEALFDEWEDELDQYSSQRLRQDSQAKLQATRRQYSRLLRAMKRAAARMEPVLAMFHDQVLYLKHNLNARAIASLKGELKYMEKDVDSLIQEMEASIAEANRFIEGLQSGEQ